MTKEQLKTTGVMSVLEERSNDMGLAFIKLGKFSSLEELISLVTDQLIVDWDDVYTLLDQGYLENEWDDDFDELQIEDGNVLYAHMRDLAVYDSICDCLIQDDSTDSKLLGFSNTGWLDIDAAVDLFTGTVGYFNSETGEYREVFALQDDDATLLNDIIFNNELDVQSHYNVTRK